MERPRDPSHKFTMFADWGPADETDHTHIAADRWNVKGNVVYFWRGDYHVYSQLTDRIIWIRRND